MGVRAEVRRQRALDRLIAPDESGCHIWTGYVHKNLGYGFYRTDDRNLLAHRMVYEMRVGPIPEGMLLHHTCENRACVNPVHLEPMTRADHIALHKVTRWPGGGGDA